MSDVFTMLWTRCRGVPSLSVVGEVGAAALPLLAEGACDVIHEASDRARLDLTAVTAFDGNGLAVLYALTERAAQTGVTLLIDPSPAVRQALLEAGLGTEL